VQLVTAKRSALSAHFHHLGVTTTAAFFAPREADDAPPHPYHESIPWVHRWAALYEREANGSLGRAWGAQDPRSYLRALVKEDGEEGLEEEEEAVVEMFVSSGWGRIRRTEEYRAMMQSMWDGRAAMGEEGYVDCTVGSELLPVGDGGETNEGDAVVKEEGDSFDDDDFYGDDMKVEEG
jgi:hypothetical protein